MKLTIYTLSKVIGIFIITMLISYSSFVSAQSFVDINAGLTGVSNSSVTWGDYDNDMDMDILISGETASGSIVTKLYDNDSGVFTDSNIEFAGLKNGWVRWGDYDNDGDLDLLATGNNIENQSFIYKNESNTFTDIYADLGYYGAYSSASWGDYDNDGDLDVFITGEWSSKLFRNEGNDDFIDSEQEFSIMTSSRTSWGDYDKDGDLDILLTGDTGGGMKLFCYINNNGLFEEIELANMGLSSGSVEWGDYDSDGDLDILIMGFNDYIEPSANIYRNDGDHVFTNIYASLAPTAMGNATWGDYDNDGDLDVLLSGKLGGCGVFITSVYENMGGDFFNDAVAGLANAERSSVAWGDYDNDTDLDIIVTGISYSGSSFTKIYRNDVSLPNLLPYPPENLSVTIEDEVVTLHWDKGFDHQIPEDGLYYNIRIGTSQLEGNILSPMANSENGYRKVYKFGNVSQSNNWKVTGLEAGTTYYWSVQTIDNTYAASEFSEEHTFYYTITNTDDLYLGESNMLVYPNPAHDKIIVNMPDSKSENIFLKIYATSGKNVLQKITKPGEQIDISNIEKGIYFLEAYINGQFFSKKLIIK